MSKVYYKTEIKPTIEAFLHLAIVFLVTERTLWKSDLFQRLLIFFDVYKREIERE